MFDRRLVQNFDWMLLIITLLLVVSGLITLYSAARAGLEITQAFYFKQLMWYGFGLVIMIATCLISYKQLDRYAYSAYAVCIFLLVAVLLAGKMVAGSKRWLVFGPISLQPSELAKVAPSDDVISHADAIKSYCGLFGPSQERFCGHRAISS